MLLVATALVLFLSMLSDTDAACMAIALALCLSIFFGRHLGCKSAAAPKNSDVLLVL